MHTWEVMAIRQLADDLGPRLSMGEDPGEYAAALDNLLFTASGELLDIARDGQGDLDLADIALEEAAKTIARARARLSTIMAQSVLDYRTLQTTASAPWRRPGG